MVQFLGYTSVCKDKSFFRKMKNFLACRDYKTERYIKNIIKSP
ncbi:hypothetical protein BACCOPRO_02857 [Phocaeicola coprophilus DSM 18228 = JCM 13818]|uniref:Uncharacterized protein n=1 Tax=Phocaeicola coprophilus DSM 18228 = JCM 13818 TaxID=547042 RepID=S0FA74_9BACT|nr:hypothetical protein BACCOPRO_02857 [Phocaeicola coprophilus DSM 18228 = JCM 13818]